MRVFLFLLFICCCQLSIAQTEKYARAKILLEASGKTIKDLQVLGIAVDHGTYVKGISFTSDFSTTELTKINAAGFKTEVLIADVQQYYVDQNKSTSPVAKKKSGTTGCFAAANASPVKPANFHLGTYGGYFTYQELLNELDSMRAKYPNLISARAPIDTFHSIEGRPIYWLRVSNFPDSNQAKPAMIYTALHHAREPASISQQVYYLWYLLENYTTDSIVKTLLNHTELYFVSCINPDGYIYNETTNPSGGGMWRKNRRNNLDGTFGVDLNRNYGYNWGYDNIGSDSNTISDTYRGTAGFSEPETQAMKWFIEQHQFQINLNYHTYSNDLIYPWGYVPSLFTPDSAQFERYGHFLTKYNQYRYGTCDQMLGYITNGSSDDWGYGEQTTKNKVFSFTPEVGPGSTGFYPPASDIEGLCADNLFANLNAAKLLLNYATIENKSALFTNQLANKAAFQLERLGMTNGGTFNVSIQALDTCIVSVGAPKIYANLNLLQTVSDSIAYQLSPYLKSGQRINYLLKINNAYFDEIDTIQVTYYSQNNTVSNLPNSSLNFNGGTWATTNSTFVSSPDCITDSPFGNYLDNVYSIFSINDTFNLTNAQSPALRFYGKWQLEKDYDYVTVAAKPITSSNWIALCGLYTHEGSINQALGEPIYDGDYLTNWLQERMPLDQFIGQKIQIRFALISDGGTNFDGFYLDDLALIGLDTALSNNGILNIKTNNAAASMQLAPNPASSQLTLQFHNFESKELRISNLLGEQQNVLETTTNNRSIEVSINSFSPGIYFITATNKKGESLVTKFVKE